MSARARENSARAAAAQRVTSVAETSFMKRWLAPESEARGGGRTGASDRGDRSELQEVREVSERTYIVLESKRSCYKRKCRAEC